MKNIYFILLLSSFLFAQGEVHKGQTYYYYLLKDSLGYDGAAFAKQHTDKQWATLFDNNAKNLKEKLILQNRELEPFTSSKKFNDISPHLKAFVMQYASNKKNTPQCAE